MKRTNFTLEDYAKITETSLDSFLKPGDDELDDIFESARYSALAGGKRLRPALLMEFYRLCGGDVQDAVPLACAIEMIHTYSLIHDDLPCMDNDDTRRGKPTNHMIYGESTAMLAGDGLLTRAFEIALCACSDKISAENLVHAVGVLAECAGMNGMIGGQVLDLKFEEYEPNADELTRMVNLKTGKLLKAACLAGCALAGENGKIYNYAKIYAQKLGLAFQIRDDVLDVVGSREVLGKSVGSDNACGKNTFVSFFGIEKCENLVEEYTQAAILSVRDIKGSEFLCSLAQSLTTRMK